MSLSDMIVSCLNDGIHANMANKAGDLLIEGIVGIQKEAMLGAGNSEVVVEEKVEDWRDVSPNTCVLPSWSVTVIAEMPGGAHPSFAQGYYKRDNANCKAWDANSHDRGSFLEWTEENVMQKSPDALTQAATGWVLRITEDVIETATPTMDELEVLRDLHARTAMAQGTPNNGEVM